MTWVTCALPVLLGVGVCQQRPDFPSFEVASVKPATPGPPGIFRGSSTKADPGRVSYTNTTLETLIVLAYDVEYYQVLGASWMASERYDVIAKIPDNALKKDIPLMLQRLLQERFNFTYHTITKEVMMHVIVVGKSGAKLDEAAEEELDPNGVPRRPSTMESGGHLTAKRVRISDLAENFSRLLEEPVLDLTNIPGIFITNWFIDPGSMFTKAAEYADEVIYIGQAGVFTDPPQLREKVFYCGPVIRPLEYGKSDRTRARGELGVPVDGFVLSCLSGTTYESNNPVFDLVMAAYDRLKFEPKRLIWVGSTDYDKIRARTAERPDVMAEDIDWKIERVMVASDVVITKGTCNILQELNWLGIPSISLSHGTNWVDDVLTNHISSNVPLSVSRVTAGGLAERIAEQFSKSREGQWPPSKPVTNGAGKAVERLAAHVERVRALLALPPQAASSKEITT